MSIDIVKQGFGFAVYPSVKLCMNETDPKTGKLKFTFVKELLFGDYIKPEINNGKFTEIEMGDKTWIKVRARNADGYILKDQIQGERILEVNFIDVGQGDGVHIVTPEDKHIIVDAGVDDHMFRYLRWRFNLQNPKNNPPWFTAVISHSDSDHYQGFDKLFTENGQTGKRFSFDTIYHNGLIETSGEGADSLGALSSDKKFVTGTCKTDSDYRVRVDGLSKKGDYIKMLEKTTAPKLGLSAGMAPLYQANNLSIDILGPYTQRIEGSNALPVFDNNKGKTKNGNSVVLSIRMENKFRLLLGGDLNQAAENYLMTNYSGVDIVKTREKIADTKISGAEREIYNTLLETAITQTRKKFESDVAKACHHGSPDFTIEFMKAVNAIATVISSGDNESYCHPRPDTLGAIGKYSRGDRPMIFCTELARSGRELFKLTGLQGSVSPPVTENSNENGSPITEVPLDKQLEKAVTVYGMISLRTDGQKVIIAQKLEKKAASHGYDIHMLEWKPGNGGFVVVDKNSRED
jgi:beta-lactamase superfamily II metal-dependent hydrolase